MATWILVPAYNEAASIKAVLDNLKGHGWLAILVVNDGSTDATAAIARSQGALVLDLPSNQGQGAALMAGITYLREKVMPATIVTFDADGQHQAADIKRLVAPLKQGAADVVLGSRFLQPGGSVPFWRTVILKLGVYLTRLVTGLSITDTHNGLRALNQVAYTKIDLMDPRMGHASEILHQIAVLKLRYQEMPVRVRYFSYRGGQSIINCIPLGFKLMRLAFKS